MRGWALSCLLASSTAAAEERTFPSVMDRRWSASMAYGVVAMRDRSPDPEARILADVDLALRLRLRPNVEAGLALGGAVVRGFGYAAIYPEVRYRMLVERPWNPYVIGSAGVATWGPPHPFGLFLRAGAGLERRFARWAFAGELHVSRVSGDADANDVGGASTFEHFGAWDTAFSVSALYYWGKGYRSRLQRVP